MSKVERQSTRSSMGWLKSENMVSEEVVKKKKKGKRRRDSRREDDAKLVRWKDTYKVVTVI